MSQDKGSIDAGWNTNRKLQKSGQSSLWNRQDKKRAIIDRPGKETLLEVAEQSGKTAPEMSPLT